MGGLREENANHVTYIHTYIHLVPDKTNRIKTAPKIFVKHRKDYKKENVAYGLTAAGAGSTTLLLRGIPVKPGGGLVAETPRPGGGAGKVVDGAGVEAFIGKEVLKPER